MSPRVKAMTSSEGMRAEERLAGDLTEAAVFGLAALVALFGVSHAFTSAPVLFTRLITEDSWFEYGAAVSFATAALLLLVPMVSSGPRSRRLIAALLCGAVFFVAGEEISWGQRILSLETPEPYAELNLQGELTLHNLAALDFINSRLHRTLSWVVLLWVTASVCLRIVRPRGFGAVRAAGVPVATLGLAPVFLLAPYYILAHPMPKASEVAEFFGSLAVVLWAIGLALQCGPSAIKRRTVRLGSMAATFVFVGAVTAALTLWRPSPGQLTYRLNLMASRDYANLGMHDQAMTLYRYIYDHPEHLTLDTRIGHGRLLLAMGERPAARQVLEEAVAEIEAGAPGTEADARLASARELLEEARQR